MISFDIFKKLSLILLCCLPLSACYVADLDEDGKPIIPMSAEEMASLGNMTPLALAEKFWEGVLSEAKVDALDLQTLKMADDESIFTRISGTVLSVNLSKKAATMEVQIVGQKVVMQIGPIIRGNSIRDAASFINFDDFKNQIQFARFAKELNKKAMGNFTRPDESWAGNQVDVLAAVTIKDKVIVETIPLEIMKR